MTSSLIINISCLIIQEDFFLSLKNGMTFFLFFLQSCSLCCQALNIFWLIQDQVDFLFICFCFQE